MKSMARMLMKTALRTPPMSSHSVKTTAPQHLFGLAETTLIDWPGFSRGQGTHLTNGLRGSSKPWTTYRKMAIRVSLADRLADLVLSVQCHRHG